MDNSLDDVEGYFKKFLAEAEKRQQKLVETERHTRERPDVTYPPLSPLLEETAQSSRIFTDASVRTEDQETTYNNNDDEDNCSVSTQENISNKLTELNYSSDLSLDLEPDDPIYRAEPVVCNSSPERPTASASRYTTPRKCHILSNPVIVESPAPLQERQTEQNNHNTQVSEETALSELSLQVQQADQTRSQLKKVVEISKYGSKEHVEAARRLQLAEIAHLCYCNQMTMYRNGYRKKTECLGSIKVSDLRVKMTAKLRNDLAQEEFAHYFFCVASCGTQIKHTEMVTTSEIRLQPLKTYIEFKESLEFTAIPSDFNIKLEVFELVTGQALPKFLSRLTPSKRTKMTPEAYFKRIGSLKLTLMDRDCNYKNLTRWSSNEESKYIDKECKFLMELKPEQLPYKFGMLDARFLDKAKPYWRRYFVELFGSQIKFWNSKQDAKDGKKPNEIIDLKDICSDKVHRLMPNDDLYRKNTFLFYTYQQVASGEKDNLLQRIIGEDKRSKVVKHQLGADSRDDKESWCTVLDKSLYAFREWHGRTKMIAPEKLNVIFTSA